jgi:hypothetical protein
MMTMASFSLRSQLRNGTLVGIPVVLGLLLAVSNWLVIGENRHLKADVQYYKSLLHTQAVHSYRICMARG